MAASDEARRLLAKAGEDEYWKPTKGASVAQSNTSLTKLHALLWIALWLASASLRAAPAEAESPVFALDLRFTAGTYGGHGEAESSVFTVRLGGGLYGGQSESESSVFALDLRGVTGPALPTSRFGLSPEFSVNLRGVRGGLNVSGTVLNATTGQPIVGARVELGTQTAATDGQGRFAVSSLAVGEYALRASMAGYAEHNASIMVAPGSQVAPLVRLQPLASAGAAPRVSGIASRFPGFLYFLDGTPFFTDFTATIDWAGHPPGKVVFVTPKRTIEKAATGPTVTATFDMGADFGTSGKLRVSAVSSGGVPSPEQEASLIVMKNPFASFFPLPMGVSIEADRFSYNASFNLDFLSQAGEAGFIPESIPVFGGYPAGLSVIPEVSCEIKSDGRARLDVKWSNAEFGKLVEEEWGKNRNIQRLASLVDDLVSKGRLDTRHFPRAGFGGFNVNLVPLVGGELQANSRTADWEVRDVFAGVAGEAKLSYSYPFPFLGLPIPAYAKIALQVEGNAVVKVLDFSPWKLEGQIKLEPELRGSLGVGLDGILALEGWLAGGLNMEWEWAQSGFKKDAYLLIKGGATVYALLWSQEYDALVWRWPEAARNTVRKDSLPELSSAEMKPLARDYVHLPGYAKLSARFRNVALAGGPAGAALKALTAPLQTKVFPFAEPASSGAAPKFGLVWLYDQPQRSANNRTMAVSSWFDGNQWSEPAPIADDGTADFHPQLLAFADGSAVTVWGNEATALPTAATFDDMKAGLEVSAAFYDPASRTWQTAQRLTTNTHLDRNPRIAGPNRNDVMVVWVSNPANDLNGSATKPNQIWFAKWNGQTWSTPQVAAEVAYPLLKHSFAYDGRNADLVLSLDTDNNLQTVADRELFRLAYQNGAWSALQRLTTDTFPDDNPQMARDPRGNIVLVWLKANQISSALNFDVTQRQVVREEEGYSSNLSDFKLAATPSGGLAIVWAEAAEFSSDLRVVFHDPTLQVWGKPKQLTYDPETERGLTVSFWRGDTLMAAYNRTQVGLTNVTETTAGGKVMTLNIPKPGGSDLFVLQYKPGEDLALQGGLPLSDPLNPVPGQKATLSATVQNLGDRPATNCVVAFYLGDPARGGTEIGRAAATEPLLAGDSRVLSFEWVVPALTAPATLYAVADPALSVAEASRANNVVSQTLVKADLGIQTMTWTKVTDTLLAITARIGNQGVISSAPANLNFASGAVNSPVLSSQSVPALEPGQSIDLTYLWDVSKVTPGTEIRAALELTDAINDFKLGDNALTMTVQPAPAVGGELRLGPLLQLANGSIQLTVTGEAGRSYTVQVSNDLVNWVDWTSFIATGSITQIVETTATNQPVRFYRAVLPR